MPNYNETAIPLDADGDGVITFTFSSAANPAFKNDQNTYVERMFSEYQILPSFAEDMFRQVMFQFSSYTGYTVLELSAGSTAEITGQGARYLGGDQNSFVTGYTTYAIATNPTSWVGLLDKTGDPNYPVGAGALYQDTNGNVDRVGFDLVLHELGHAFGFKHPANHLVTSPSDSMMGYGWGAAAAWYSATYSATDILGLQALYGTPDAIQRDDVILVHQDTPRQTVFDTGGYDVIDARLATTGLTLSLKPGSLGQFAGVPSGTTIAIAYGRDDVLAERANLPVTRGAVRSADMTIEAISGTNFSDVLQGNAVDNVLAGMGGHDRLVGTGNDFLVGGAGNDRLEGQGGDYADYNNVAAHPLLTGRAAQVVQDGNVAIVRGIKVDMTRSTFQVYDDGTGDPVAGTVGMDDLVKIGGIIGTSFADTIKLGSTGSAMKVIGGGGNDIITARNAADVIDGGEGVDTVAWDYASASDFVKFDMTTGDRGGLAAIVTMFAVENLTGGAGNDTLGGDAGDNVLIGGGGDDRLIGYGGYNILSGGAGRDIYVGGAGVDVFVDRNDGNTLDYSASQAAVTLTGGAYHSVVLDGVAVGGGTLRGVGGDAEGDIMIFVAGGQTSVPMTVIGSNHGDKLSATSTLAMKFLAGSADDQIWGSALGNDTIYGGGGRDTIDPGAGDDFVDFGEGGGTLRYATTHNGVLNLDMNTGIAKFMNGSTVMETDVIVGSYDTIDSRGNIIGTGAEETFLNATNVHGGGGDDVIFGAFAYGVTLYGDDGDDRLIANVNGTSTLYGGAGDDILEGPGTLIGGTGADRLIGTGNSRASYETAESGISLVGKTGTGGDALGDILSGIGIIIGSAHADSISGVGGWVYGGDGDDVINATGATIYGGNGNDVITGSVSWVYGEAGDDVFYARIAYGGDGNDTFFGYDTIDTYYGDAGDDLYRPGKGADVIFMNGGADTLVLAKGEGGDSISDFTSGVDRIGIIRQAGYLDPTVTWAQNGPNMVKATIAWQAEQAPGAANPPPPVYETITFNWIQTLSASDFYLI